MTRDLVLDVALAIRSAVLPLIGSEGGRGAAGTAVGGDVTFGIDVVAEDRARALLTEVSDLAWYTEDHGLTVNGSPRRLLVIDPIDGTRPAGAGLESSVVAIAAAPFSEDAVFADVDDALVLEIKTGTLFRARRGEGVRIVARGETRTPTPSSQTSVEGAFWVYGLRGRPAMPSAVVLEELLDATGVSGGTFDLGSAAFDMTRLVTGQIDAYVDHGQRIVDDLPQTRGLFEEVGGGSVLNNSPYDVAAAALICEEAGCVVTDARGHSLDGRPLIGSGPDHQVSTLAVSTPELHASMLAALDRGIDRLRERLSDGLASGGTMAPRPAS